MRQVPCSLLASFVVIAVVAACGDSGGPSGPAAVSIVSGNSQSARINSQLAQPLVVRVTGSGGGGFQGATVAWAVTSGPATVSPVSIQTDADGRASTLVSLGATAGAVTVSATVSGLTPVSFAVTSIGPQTITKVAGDGQTGPVGGGPPDTLVVHVLGTDGQPYAGGTVTWTVTSGTATVNPASATVAANGQAVTRVSLFAAGNVSLTGSVTGLPAVTFTVTAVPACDYRFPYTVGRTVDGQLSALDCGLDLGGIYYYDFYQFTVPSQQGVVIAMTAPAGTPDSWLDLLSLDGAYLGFNDDSALGVSKAFVEAIVSAGTYVIGASSWGAQETGPYLLRSAAQPTAIAGCRPIWATRAITVTETVATTDCASNPSGTPFYLDRLLLGLESGATLEVRMQSAAVNPLIYLYDLIGDSLAVQNDDSAVGTTTAYISFTHGAPSFSFFELGLATAAGDQTGAYTVTISGPVAMAGTAAAARGATPFVLPERLLRDKRMPDLSAAAARARAARVRGLGSP